MWPKTRNEVISTPVIVENVVYIANGQDPEHGEGVGHLYAIDPTKTGDITKSGMIWHYDKIRRSISTGAIYNGILFYADFSGFLHALDAKTGKPFWTHDMFAAIWGSPIVIGDKVYLGDEDGDVTVLNADKTLKVVAESNMGSSVYSTPVPANGALFIVNRNELFAISSTGAAEASERRKTIARALFLGAATTSAQSRALLPPSLDAVPRHAGARLSDAKVPGTSKCCGPTTRATPSVVGTRLSTRGRVGSQTGELMRQSDGKL